MVSHGGTSYMCISNVSGTTTPNADTSNWDTMAGKGDIGVTGAQGTTGNTGSQGPIGNTGPSGFPSGGAPGQVVTNTGSGAGIWQDAAAGGKILQVLRHAMPVATISVPHRNNNYAEMRQVPSQSIAVTTTAANSKILITGGINIRTSSHTHDYFDMKRTLSSNGNTEWLSKLSPYWGGNTDGLVANHTGNINDSTNAPITYLLSPNVPAGTVITFTYWVGMWGAGTVWWNEYGNGNAHGITEFIYQEVSA
jgi:hypothetical protein